MSEYQFYEFQALDKALSAAQVKALRAYSSRATITPRAFSVTYNYGDFKGNQDKWMESYFDAFLYIANWGSKALQISIPAACCKLQALQTYRASGSVKVRQSKDRCIFEFAQDHESDGYWCEGDGRLDVLVGLRAELMRGDWRVLYLAWLAHFDQDAMHEQLSDSDVEPVVPPGLDTLSVAQAAFAKLFGVDESLLAVAAQTSAPLQDVKISQEEVRDYVEAMPAGARAQMLADFISADTDHLARQQHNLIRERRRAASAVHPGPRRTVGSLREAATLHAVARKQQKLALAKKAAARKQAIAAAQRQQRLETLIGKEASLWRRVENLVSERTPKSYEAAAGVLEDLRDLHGPGKADKFQARMAKLRATHARKGNFLKLVHTL